MNKRVDQNIRSSVEPETRFANKLTNASTRRQGRLFSNSVFFANHRYQTQIEHIARIDVSQSVSRLVKRLNRYLSDADAVNGANQYKPDLATSIASEFRELAGHLYYAMKVLVQEAAARFNRKLLELDHNISAIDRKIDECRTRSPELLHTVFLQAEFNLRQSSINENAARGRFERFRKLHNLRHRNPPNVTAYSISVAGTFAVCLVGLQAVFNTRMLEERFVGNQLDGFTIALACAIANLFFGSVFVGRFGVRYLIHDKLTKKLFPGVLSILLGLLGIFAIALVLSLMVAETNRLPVATSDDRSSTNALAAQHATKLEQTSSNANTTILGLRSAESFSNKSISVFLATLLSAVFAYTGSLFISDLYPGFSAADRAVQVAQNEQGSNATKGEKMITNAERSIVADLRKSLRATEPLVADLESEVVSLQVFISDATYVTGVLNEGCQDCLSRYHRSSTAQRIVEVEEAAAGAKFASDQLTSVLTALGVESEEHLRRLNVMLSKKLAKADALLQRRIEIIEEVDELINAIRQCAAEYRLRLTQEQDEYEQRRTTAISVARATPTALKLESASEESRIIL